MSLYVVYLSCFLSLTQSSLSVVIQELGLVVEWYIFVIMVKCVVRERIWWWSAATSYREIINKCEFLIINKLCLEFIIIFYIIFIKF